MWGYDSNICGWGEGYPVFREDRRLAIVVKDWRIKYPLNIDSNISLFLTAEDWQLDPEDRRFGF